MKKIIQKIRVVLALSASLLSHASTFAATSFDSKKELAYRIDIKMWGKNSIKTAIHRFFIAPEFDPFVEWKPFDNIGIETGLLYGYNL